MTKAALKKNIHKTIDIVNDEGILNAIYLILSKSVKLDKESEMPFSVSEYLDRQKLSLKQIKEGKTKAHHLIKKKYSG